MGPRPAGDGIDVAPRIAAKLGYPSASENPFSDPDGLFRLTWREAAHVIAVAGTTSLAYGSNDPDQYWIDEAARALRWLGHDAIFLGNGFSNGAMAAGWNPLTCATFDSGVIGYDARTAFIFWVEDED